MIIRVEPVIDYNMRKMCARPYEGHPRGCPKLGKGEQCPPRAPRIEDFYDMQKPFYAITTEFDLAAHVERMRQKHPDWSRRQLRNMLFWQGSARKTLREEIKRFRENTDEPYEVTDCPEAMGVNVTATLKSVGIALEWPPENIVRHVALAGIPKNTDRDSSVHP